MSYKIIDAHTHVFAEKIADKAVPFIGKYYGYPMQGTGRLEDLRSSMKEGKVTAAVTFSTATKAAQVERANSYTASLIGNGIYGFGTIHMEYENYKEELKRIKNLGLKGIKLHPDFQGFDADTPDMFPIYEEIIKNELPVLFHCGDTKSDHSNPKRLRKVIDLYPEMTVIGAHFGGYSVYDLSEEHLIGQNLYIDTSSSLHLIEPDETVRLIRKHGTHKVLFATDYPLFKHNDELERFFKLPLTEQEREDILWNNMAKLLGI